MACNSAIYTVNSNANVAANGTIPFGSIIRRFGQSVQLDGSDITVCGQGYYDVDCSVTLLPVAAGNIGIQLYADGAPVPGANAQGVGVAASPLNLSITSLVRQKCCGASSLSLKLVTPTGVTTGATVQTCACSVKRL